MLELQQRCVGGVVVFNGRSASLSMGAEQTQTHSHKPTTHLASDLEEYVQGKREVPPLPDKPPEKVAIRKVAWPGRLFSVALDLSRSQQRARWWSLRHEALPK
jgi:hypothetical protein